METTIVGVSLEIEWSGYSVFPYFGLLSCEQYGTVMEYDYWEET